MLFPQMDYNRKKFQFTPNPTSPCPYLDENLHRIAFTLKGRNDADYLCVIIGAEGSGKSNIGLYSCKTVDEALGHEFTVKKQVFYGSGHFLKYAAEITEPQSVLIDESETSLFSRDWNKEGNRNFVKALMQVRVKHIAMFLIIPDFRMIDTYVRNHRVDSIIMPEMYYNSYTGDYIRGPFKVYNRKKIRRIKMFREGGMQLPYPNFWEIAPDLYGSEIWDEYKAQELPRKNEALAVYSKVEGGHKADEEKVRKPRVFIPSIEEIYSRSLE